MQTHIKQLIRICFIGETANNKLKQIIVGIKTIERVNEDNTAPSPAAIPPRQPTIRSTIDISPNLLNSASSKNLSIFIILSFVINSKVVRIMKNQNDFKGLKT